MSQAPDDALIHVEYGTMQDATTNVQNTVNFTNQQLGDLKQYLASIKEMWQGDAGDMYRDLQAQWDKAAADLNQVLAQVPPELQNALQDYQANEKKLAGLWSGGLKGGGSSAG
jgi:WXG100 family type VII secretion target